MTCPNCEQMLSFLEALSGPEPAELVRVRTETAVTLPDDGNYTVDVTTEVQETSLLPLPGSSGPSLQCA